MEQQFDSFIRGRNDNKHRRCYPVAEVPADARNIAQDSISSSHTVALVEVLPGKWVRQVVALDRIERIEIKKMNTVA